MLINRTDKELIGWFTRGKLDYPHNNPPNDPVLAEAYRLGYNDGFINKDFGETTEQILKYIKTILTVK